MSENIVLYWIRQDLRLSDNPALTAAAERGTVLPIYILDDVNSGDYLLGAASKFWLHHSLVSLNISLNNKLRSFRGDPLEIIQDLIKEHDIKDVFWNRCYEPWRIKRDKHIKNNLTNLGVNVQSYNSSLLWEPWDIKKDNGDPYKVFTPFYRKGCLTAKAPREPLSEPKNLNLATSKLGDNIDSLKLIPNEDWPLKLKKVWHIGERYAQEQCQNFLDEGMSNYKEGRNLPAKPFVSRLSPHLHHGEISPNQIWYTVLDGKQDKNTDHFLSELGWREFSYSQLYFNPELPKVNLQAKFDNFPWDNDLVKLKAWQKGLTGIPMVDAGMRELWQTGYMHNRVRMIVGSFLVKNLLLDWRHGERWFWDCLVDADLASNSAGWQWIAGCGADAAPYFRIFNCVTQGQKFDPDGDYVRHYIPELKNLPNKFLFNPWEAPLLVLKEAGVELGENYPEPIVDLKKSREYALAAFSSLKQE
ncbi:MAG: deoxyribodipyrimidine photo-lyase [Pseudomonadota bacterium]|nr:deoxyribodipyrimidine photo-lyase [Pseudomonadota bacterium]